MADLGTIMGLYLFTTIIFFGLKFFYSKSPDGKNQGNFNPAYKIVYITLVILMSFFSNLKITNTVCGGNDYFISMIVSVVPWMLILGSLTLLLQCSWMDITILKHLDIWLFP